MEVMDNPSMSGDYTIVRMNLVQDCPITSATIKLLERISGPDVATIKGKTTRRTPLPVMDCYIEIPRELISPQKQVTVTMDDTYVNSLQILTSILKNLYYRIGHYSPKKTNKYHKQATNDIISTYKKGGFLVTEIQCDNAICPLVQCLEQKYPFLRFNCDNPQEHVPKAERNIQVFKEKFESNIIDGHTCIYVKPLLNI